MRIKDLLAKYGISRHTYYKWIEKGMPHSKVGGVVILNEAEVEQWIKEQNND